jgi:hypothetical protein
VKPARWWYHNPKRLTRLWWFDFLTSTDEFCNPTFYVQLPFLGAWVFRYKRGPIRTEACEQCQRDMGPWCHGCQGCHRGPRCHDWLSCDHDTKDIEYCPACGGDYCTNCEPNPKQTCPYRGDQS